MAHRTRGALTVLGLVLVAGALAACTAADVKLRHPSTGQNAVCPGGYPRGLAALTNQTANEIQFRCVDNYVRQGYERVSE
jgi:hypothetical protein